ncbi:MAG TPA: LL-diaminopimelate aminotransferase [Limnochordia bacterium]|nr:LL-diaminopimelate aminotransferase [Limnochordia bacterium]
MAQESPSSNYIQSLFAQRIGGRRFGEATEIYKFEKIKRAKQAARAEHPGVELIDMGVGEPDARADDGVVATLAREAAVPANRFYADNGIPEFKAAAARYMERVFGVQLDPEREINHAIGSKSALAMLPSAFVDPGDVVLMTAPGYGVLGTLSKWLGAEIVDLPLRRENGFLPDLKAIPPAALQRAKLLYLNYPNNPTGASAPRAFLEEAVAFARKNEILIVYDAAYAALTFDGAEPVSFLAVPGAKEVGIEVQSLSKAFNMTGWRIAFVAGHERVVNAFATVKDNFDSGQFRAVQKAGVYALDHPEITQATARKYSRRHDRLVAALREVGFDAQKPQASFYLYVPAPKGTASGRTFATAEAFSEYLIREHLISTVPWDDAGPFVRFSVTFEAKDDPEDEARVIDELLRRLRRDRFVF